MGKILGELNYLNQAKKYYEKALNLNPNINETLDEYGKILLKLNKHAEGLNFIRKGTGFIRFEEKNFSLI